MSANTSNQAVEVCPECDIADCCHIRARRGAPTTFSSLPAMPDLRYHAEFRRGYASCLVDVEKLRAQAAPTAAAVQPSDGDYLRWAKRQGATIVWEGDNAGVHFTTSSWAAFCNVLRDTPPAAAPAVTAPSEAVAKGGA